MTDRFRKTDTTLGIIYKFLESISIPVFLGYDPV